MEAMVNIAKLVAALQWILTKYHEFQSSPCIQFVARISSSRSKLSPLLTVKEATLHRINMNKLRLDS